jgi:predicted nucleic acid-binding protein
MKNRLVCLDTNICGWVFRDEEPPTDQQALINYVKSIRLVKALTKQGFILMIPSIVLSELLCRFSESEQNARFVKFKENNKFLITDFTFTTSMILARILHQRYITEGGAYKEIISSDGVNPMTKAMMKYDSLILAMAVENGASCFYTVDNGFSKYPKHFIPIRGLDEAPYENLFSGFFEEE